MDMEFEKVRDKLEIVELNTTAVREHVPEIENQILLIKERMRCTTSDFPFNPIPRLVLIHIVYTCVMCINAIPRKAGMVKGISPRELVTGRTVDYKRDCRACMGGYVEASTGAIVTNYNTPRTHSCIALGPSGNRQGSVKCFDLETGKVVVRRTVNHIPWPERIIDKASVWGRLNKEIIANNGIQFRNRHGGKFDWDNDDMFELEVTTELTKMIHPDMVANIPGIELDSDFLQPAVPASGEKPDIMTQLAAARLNAGLGDEVEANIELRGVIEVPDISLLDDVDPGVSQGQEVLPAIEEEQEILP